MSLSKYLNDADAFCAMHTGCEDVLPEATRLETPEMLRKHLLMSSRVTPKRRMGQNVENRSRRRS
jgi:hypothetical protein